MSPKLVLSDMTGFRLTPYDSSTVYITSLGNCNSSDKGGFSFYAADFSICLSSLDLLLCL